MKLSKLKAIAHLARKAREQRNATKTNDDFDYWHNILNEYELQLKTQENKKWKLYYATQAIVIILRVKLSFIVNYTAVKMAKLWATQL